MRRRCGAIGTGSRCPGVAPGLASGLVLALLMFAAGPAQAHRLLVFASAEGADIRGSAYFAGGLPARGVRLLVQDADGALLAELQPDAEGAFSYRALAPVAHRIVAEGADGHRAEWTIGADELAGAFSGGASTPPAAARSPDAGGPPPTSAGLSATAAPAAQPALSPEALAAIETAVARQVRPLREQLAAAEARVRLRDVLGGLGYIVGLAGLALWWRRRG